MVNTSTIPRVLPLILVITIAALTTTTTSARSLWPYKHVHVSNELKTYNGILHVHCWSKDDDLGNHDVGVGAEYTWRFRPSVLGTTKWTCEVSTDDHRRAEFDSYRAMAAAVCEIQWLRYLLHDFGIPVPDPVPVYTDSISALKMAENPVAHERTKHIEMDCHIVRDKVTEGVIQVNKVDSSNNIADLLTKPLGTVLFRALVSKLNMLNIHV